MSCGHIIILNCRSFGHFQAHEYGIASGFSHDILKGRIGFAKTRLSVTKVQDESSLILCRIYFVKTCM